MLLKIEETDYVKLSTLFPVLFAAIVGRLMVQMARFKLEQGSTLGSLEQLLGSRTVGGAILTPFHLKSLNLLALALVFLWAFSPLGAQALLRFVEPRHTGIEESAEAAYFNTRAPPAFNEFAQSSTWFNEEGAQIMNIIDRMYSGVILAPMSVKEDPMDLWGNVKIPLLMSTAIKKDDWTDVSKDRGYSSLVGIPMANITNGNTTFTMESTYLKAVCDSPKFYGVNAHGQIDLNDTDTVEIGESKRSVSDESYSRFYKPILGNGTYQGAGHSLNGPWSLAVDRLIDINWANGSWVHNKCDEDMLVTDGEDCTDVTPGAKNATLIDSVALLENEEGIEAGPTSLLFQAVVTSYDASTRLTYGTYCNITQEYAENKVDCRKLGNVTKEVCSVSAQRPSREPHPPKDISFLSFPRVMHAVSEFMPKSGGPNMTTLTAMDFTLQYLADPSVANISAPNEGALNFENIDANGFSERMTQVLNSYINLGQMYTDVTGNGNIRQSTTVPSEVTHAVVVFRIDKLWAAFCVISIFVLLAGGLASTVLAHMASGPAVLGFASTVVRDSRYIKLPDDLAGAEGLEITEKFRDIRLRFGVLHELGDGATAVGTGFEGNVSRVKDVLRERKKEG